MNAVNKEIFKCVFISDAIALRKQACATSHYRDLPYPQRSDLVVKYIRKYSLHVDKVDFNNMVNGRMSIDAVAYAMEKLVGSQKRKKK